MILTPQGPNTTGRLAARALAALLLGALILPAAAPAKKPKKNQAVVIGKVFNQQDEALAGASVTVTSSLDPAFRLEATSDDKGEFTLSVTDPQGDYVFHLEAEGYAPFEDAVALQAGEEANLGFRLIDAATGRRQDAIKAFNDGAAAFNQESYADATGKFQEAAELDPTMPEPHQGLAEIHFREKDYEAAAAEIEKFLAAKPDDVGALSLAYMIYRELGNAERTEALIEALGKTEKAKPLARQIYNEGVAAVQKGDSEQAIERFRRAAVLDPELAPAYSSQATILYNEQRYQEAAAALEKLFALDPENVQGRRVNFLIYDALDDSEKAAAALDAYLAVDPDGALDVMYQRADMDFRDGRTDKAIAALRKIIERKPDMARAHYTLGLAYASSDKAKAKLHLQKFLELAPDDPEASTAKEILSYL